MSVFKGKLVHSNPRLTAWRNVIKEAIKQCNHPVMIGAVYAYMVFELPRPKTVNRPRPCVKPDLDKLVRAALDAIESSGIISNDSQICEIQAVKIYSEQPRLKLFLRGMI
jgi:Holliday junction resolvase RusA-like endonuclease